MEKVRKRNRSASRRSRGLTWVRIGYLSTRFALTTAIVGLSLVVVGKVLHPYHLNWTENRQLQADRRTRDALKADNDRLERRKAYLNTPEGELAQTRSLGYHNPGEHPLRVQDTTPSAAPAPGH